MKLLDQHKRGRKPYELPRGAQVDWKMTNKDIANQLGTTLMTIMLLRKRLGVEPLPRGRPTLPAPNKVIQRALDAVYNELSKRLQEKKSL